MIAIGNTGCGKSTMLSSLMFGPDKLEEKENKNGRKVLDQKEGYKVLGQLAIGHGATSQTFRPEIAYSDELGCFLLDIAGFTDTNGEFFDLLNSFVIKYIFLHAKSVRFLLPFTFGEIGQNRG